MYVLHAHWQPPATPAERGRVFFWAETSAATPPRARRGQAAPPDGKTRLHPFCAAAGEVLDLLAHLPAQGSPAGDGETVSAAEPGTSGSPLTLLLPTLDYGPRPSPQLVHEWTLPEDAPAALAAWQIAGVWLSDRRAFELLAGLPLEGEAMSGVSLGADARFWHVATGVVLDALAGHKLVPVLVPAGGEQRPLALSRSLAGRAR